MTGDLMILGGIYQAKLKQTFLWNGQQLEQRELRKL